MDTVVDIQEESREVAQVRRAVLFDVDGTLVDAVENQRRVWHAWAEHFGKDPATVYRTALATRPTETFELVCPDEDPERCLRVLATLEDDDARSGRYQEFPGAADLLRSLPAGSWGLVTSNYEHRVRIRFRRLGLPLPAVIVDAAAVERGKPDPAPYLLAAQRLGADPRGCIAVEDSRSGVHSAAAAGMRVISVNSPDPVPGSHHHVDTLRSASHEIRAFITGRASGSPAVTPPGGP